MSSTKQCKRCKDVKDSDEFYPSVSEKDGLQPYCVTCCSEYHKDYYWEHKQKILDACHEYRDKNKPKRSQYQKYYAKRNRQQIQRNKEIYYVENKERFAKNGALYYQRNRIRLRGMRSKQRSKFSEKVVLFMGEECVICGLRTNRYEVYHCHHKDPEEKDTNIGNMRCKDWETETIPELSKCVLVCRECHNCLHKQITTSLPDRSNTAKYLTNRKELMKAKCVEYLGSRCQICGRRHAELPRYEFHHVDPKSKSFGIVRNLSRAWESLHSELNKCALLCGNCHVSFHYGRYPDITLIPGPAP